MRLRGSIREFIEHIKISFRFEDLRIPSGLIKLKLEIFVLVIYKSSKEIRIDKNNLSKIRKST